jgi:hypothetical protein
MGEYKKITKEDINFPKYCLFFIKKIQEAIDKSKSDLSYVEFLKVEVETTYPYCSEAFDLIAKTFTRKGLEMRTPTYKMNKVDGIPHYLYNWGVRKEVDYDDLPFDEYYDIW